MAMFFLMPSRLYQFCAGSLALLFYDAVGPELNILWHAIGSVLVAVSFCLVHPEHGPIGLTSLPTVVGTMMLIASPRGALAGRWGRENEVLRYIGKLSYSTYLVHWPAICMSSYCFVYKLHAKVFAFVLTVVVSPIMFHTVEEEFRATRHRTKSLTGILFCVLLGTYIFTYALTTAYSVQGVTFKGQKMVQKGTAARNGSSHNTYPRKKELVLPTSKGYQMEIEKLLKYLRARGTLILDHPTSAK